MVLPTSLASPMRVPSEKPSSVIMGLHRLLCESIKVPGVAPVLNRLVLWDPHEYLVIVINFLSEFIYILEDMPKVNQIYFVTLVINDLHCKVNIR